MRHLTLFLTFCLLLWVAASTPINVEQNDFAEDDTFGLRTKRRVYYRKHKDWPKHQFAESPTPLEYRVRKGEYVCGNKICALKPGEVPEGCNGMCQYPINFPILT